MAEIAISNAKLLALFEEIGRKLATPSSADDGASGVEPSAKEISNAYRADFVYWLIKEEPGARRWKATPEIRDALLTCERDDFVARFVWEGTFPAHHTLTRLLYGVTIEDGTSGRLPRYFSSRLKRTVLIEDLAADSATITRPPDRHGGGESECLTEVPSQAIPLSANEAPSPALSLLCARPLADVLLVTVNRHESTALHARFPPVAHGPYEGYHYFDLGEINGARVVHTISEMGSQGSGAMRNTVDRALEATQASIAIAVGIAWGADEKKQRIGDVLVSKTVHMGSLQKRVDGARIDRGASPDVSPTLLNRFRSADHALAASSGAESLKVHFGPLISEERLFDCEAAKAEALKQVPEAIGGEMEGEGFYGAIRQREPNVDWIIVKAICDWGCHKDCEGNEADQQLAAANAAHFLRYTMESSSFHKSPNARSGAAEVTRLDVGRPPGEELSPIVHEIHDETYRQLHQLLENWPCLCNQLCPETGSADDALEQMRAVVAVSVATIVKRTFYAASKTCLERMRGTTEFNLHWQKAKEIVGHLCVLGLDARWLERERDQAKSGAPLLHVEVGTKGGIEVVSAGRWGRCPSFREVGDRRPSSPVGAYAIEIDSIRESGTQHANNLEQVLAGIWLSIFTADREAPEGIASDPNLQKKLKNAIADDRENREMYHYVPVDLGDKKSILTKPTLAALRAMLDESLFVVWGSKDPHVVSPFRESEDDLMGSVVSFLLMRAGIEKNLTP